MQVVEMELNNIQSHRKTRFKLCDNLTVIHGRGNNLGKSTIFKVIEFTAKYPNIKDIEVLEQLRVGEQEASVVYRFSEHQFTLKIHKTGLGRLSVYLHDDVANVTLQHCPKELTNALGLVLYDNNILNMYCANKTYLVADESKQSDEVLSFVLQDETVERIKENSTILLQRVNSDLNDAEVKLQNLRTELSHTIYNQYVDDYFSERDILYKISYVENKVNMLSFTEEKIEFSFSQDDLNLLQRQLNVAIRLESICNMFSDRINLKPIEEPLDDLMSVLVKLTEFISYAESSILSSSIASNAKAEYKELLEEVRRSNLTVKCPVLGEVIYGEKCLPVSD